MSAVLRWRCDICRKEAEVVQEVKRGVLEFFHPALPSGWLVETDGKKKFDLCSQACVVVHHQHLLVREQWKLSALNGGSEAESA